MTAEAQTVVEESTSEAPWTHALQRRAFRALNAVMRPAIQRGFGAPCLAPWGLVVLEHTGRRTGRTYESPLLALRLGRRVMVTTYRKDRSQWIRNLEDQPETHLWLNGSRKPYRALVLRGDTEPEKAKARVGHRLWQSAQALLAAGFAVSVLEPA
jgi:hypothetical protein